MNEVSKTPKEGGWRENLGGYAMTAAAIVAISLGVFNLFIIRDYLQKDKAAALYAVVGHEHADLASTSAVADTAKELRQIGKDLKQAQSRFVSDYDLEKKVIAITSVPESMIKMLPYTWHKTVYAWFTEEVADITTLWVPNPKSEDIPKLANSAFDLAKKLGVEETAAKNIAYCIRWIDGQKLPWDKATLKKGDDGMMHYEDGEVEKNHGGGMGLEDRLLRNKDKYDLARKEGIALGERLVGKAAFAKMLKGETPAETEVTTTETETLPATVETTPPAGSNTDGKNRSNAADILAKWKADQAAKEKP